MMTLTFLTEFAALVSCFRQRLCLTNWTETERYQEQDGEDLHGRIQSIVANRRFAMVLCQGRLETVMDEMRQRGRIEGRCGGIACCEQPLRTTHKGSLTMANRYQMKSA